MPNPTTINGITYSANKTTDANGWTKYDHGTYQEYKKRVTFSQTFSGLSALTTSSTNLPVGMSTLSTNFLTYSYTATGNAGSLIIVYEGSSSSGGAAFTADTADNVSRTYTGFIDITITTQ